MTVQLMCRRWVGQQMTMLYEGIDSRVKATGCVNDERYPYASDLLC